jgi:CRISPR type IV-associated protein Csf1
MLSPTQLIKQICALPSKSTAIAKEDSQCAICGSLIAKGDKVQPLTLKDSFTNARDLASFNSTYSCDCCNGVLTDQNFQKSLSACVYTTEGIFPANKKIHRGYWLMNPPATPFLFVLGVSKSQHVVWRAPVNVSDKFIFIQLGDERLKIRVDALHNAVRVAKELKEIKIALDMPTMGKNKPLRYNPFSYSDLKGQRLFQCEPQRWLVELIENVEYKKIAQPLFELNAHECWALDFCLTEGLVKPDPLDK